MRNRGSILVQVLIMGALLLILVTILIKGVTQHYQFGALATAGSSAGQNSQASIDAVQSAWTLFNGGRNCTSNTWPNGDKVCCDVACDNAKINTCTTAGCTCTVQINGVAYPSVTAAANAAGNCQLSIQKSYP